MSWTGSGFTCSSWWAESGIRCWEASKEGLVSEFGFTSWEASKSGSLILIGSSSGIKLSLADVKKGFACCWVGYACSMGLTWSVGLTGLTSSAWITSGSVALVVSISSFWPIKVAENKKYIFTRRKFLASLLVIQT